MSLSSSRARRCPPIEVSTRRTRAKLYAVEPVQTLLVHADAFPLQQDAETPVPEPAAFGREAAQALAHFCVALFRLPTNCLRIDLDQPTGSPLREATFDHQAERGFPAC